MVNMNTCWVGVNTKRPKCRHISLPTAACKSIHSILHAGLASNHSWFGGRILYLSKSIDCFPSTDFIFCQALIISPVSCIFTVNTAMDRVVTEYMARCCFHWQDCSNMSKVYTKISYTGLYSHYFLRYWYVGHSQTYSQNPTQPLLLKLDGKMAKEVSELGV